jgi:sugar phosphate permease
VGSTGSGKQTVTRTTGSVAPMASRAKSTVWLAVGVVDLVLALDFVFKLLASTAVGFVGFIASVATALAAPFRGVMATSVTTGHYANWPNVVGIVVYLIAAWIVVSLIGITATRRPPQPDRI